MGLSYVTRKGLVTLAHTAQLDARRTDRQLSACVLACETYIVADLEGGQGV